MIDKVPEALAVLAERASYIGGEGYDATADDLMRARNAVAELINKADTVATVLSNLIAAGQVDAGYSGHVTDLTAALAAVEKLL